MCRSMKKGILIGIVIGISLFLAAIVLLTTQNNQNTTIAEIPPKILVTITMSASRPGCEKTDCYMPTELSVAKQDTVTWVNDDSGFHTVTAGYDATPDGTFDSG